MTKTGLTCIRHIHRGQRFHRATPQGTPCHTPHISTAPHLALIMHLESNKKMVMWHCKQVNLWVDAGPSEWPTEYDFENLFFFQIPFLQFFFLFCYIYSSAVKHEES